MWDIIMIQSDIQWGTEERSLGKGGCYLDEGVGKGVEENGSFPVKRLACVCCRESPFKMHGECGEGEGDQIMKGVDFVKYDVRNGKRWKKPIHPSVCPSIHLYLCVCACVYVGDVCSGQETAFVS